MSTLPQNVTELYLAPVVLSVDARLQEMSTLSVTELTERVKKVSKLRGRSGGERAEALLRTIEHGLDMHGWQLTMDPRGIKLTHDTRRVVLGAPAVFDGYITG